MNYHNRDSAAIIITLLLVLTMIGCTLVNSTESTQSQINEPSKAPVNKSVLTQPDGETLTTGSEDSRVSNFNDSTVLPTTAPEEERDGDTGNIGDGPTMENVDITVSDGRGLSLAMPNAQSAASGYRPQTYGQIQVLDGNNIIQTITQDEATLNKDYLFEGFLPGSLGPQIQDVNFDGAEDFGLICGRSYNGPLCCFVWD